MKESLFTRKRYSLALLCIHVIGVIAVLLIFASYHLKKDYIHSLGMNSRMAVAVVEDRISTFFSLHVDFLRSIASNQAVRNYMVAPNDAQTEKLREMLRVLAYNNGDGSSLVLTDRNGRQLLRTDKHPLVTIADRPYFREAIEGKEIISDTIMSKAGARLITVICEPVYDQEGSVIGIVQRNIPLSAYQNLVKNLTEEDLKILILDRIGRLLADSSRSNISEKQRNELNGKNFVASAEVGMVSFYDDSVFGEQSFTVSSRDDQTNFVISAVVSYSSIWKHIMRTIIEIGFVGIGALILVLGMVHLVLRNNGHDVRESDDDTPRQPSTPENVDHSQPLCIYRSQRVSAVDEIKEGEIDPVSQFLTKEAMIPRCEAAMQRPDSDKSVLYVVDLDHFDELCQKRGVEYVEKLIREFSSRMRKHFRPGDLLGRIDDRRFLIFLTGFSSVESMSRKASQIIVTARGVCLDSNPVGLTASLGYAVCPEDGTTYDTLYDAAVEAMQRVKHNGRDGYCRLNTAVFHE